MSYHKQKLDANHKPIADELRRRGVEVLELLQPLDMLCQYRGFMGLVEAKIVGSRARYTRKQLQFIAGSRMSICIATDAEQAMQFLTEQRGLDQDAKDRLAYYLMKTVKPLYVPSEIEKVLQ